MYNYSLFLINEVHGLGRAMLNDEVSRIFFTPFIREFALAESAYSAHSDLAPNHSIPLDSFFPMGR
jgi:hypothetical protein